MNTRNYASENCKQVEEQRLRRETLQHFFGTSRVLFHINYNPLPPSEALPYLGSKLAYNNINWPVVFQNHKKAQRLWGVILRVFTKIGATVQSHGMVYNSVAHSVLRYGSESWVVTVVIVKFLERFHHREFIRITSMMVQCVAGGEWGYPLVVVALEIAGLHPIQEYVRILKSAIAEQVACCPFYEICIEAERGLGTSWMVIWWNQDMVYESEE